MLANNVITPTCFAIFQLIKFMCFGSTLVTRTNNFSTPARHEPKSTRARTDPHSSVGSCTCRKCGYTQPAWVTPRRAGPYSTIRNTETVWRIKIVLYITVVMWSSQRSVRVSVLLMYQNVDVRISKNSRLKQTIEAAVCEHTATPPRPTWIRDPPVGNHCFRAIVSLKPGTRQGHVLGEILSRKSGTRQTDVSGQLCHVNLAHGTETFQGKYYHVNLAHGKQAFQGNCVT